MNKAQTSTIASVLKMQSQISASMKKNMDTVGVFPAYAISGHYFVTNGYEVYITNDIADFCFAHDQNEIESLNQALNRFLNLLQTVDYTRQEIDLNGEDIIEVEKDGKTYKVYNLLDKKGHYPFKRVNLRYLKRMLAFYHAKYVFVDFKDKRSPWFIFDHDNLQSKNFGFVFPIV